MSTEMVDFAQQQVRALFVHAYQQAYELRHGTKTTAGNRRIPRWDGGYDKENSTNYKVNWWARIASVCAQHQADPAAFIAAQFTNRARLPEPSQCVGEAAVERYHAQAGSAESDLRIAFESQRMTLQVEAGMRVDYHKIDQRQAVEQVLGDTNVALSGLFRYLVAARFGFDEIADRYRGSAATQFVYRRDAYMQAWGDYGIPEELREAAEAIMSGGTG